MKCNFILDTYGNDLLKYAMHDYQSHYNVTKGNTEQPLTGALQCWCD